MCYGKNLASSVMEGIHNLVLWNYVIMLMNIAATRASHTLFGFERPVMLY